MSQYPNDNELFENHFGQFTPQVKKMLAYVRKLALYNRDHYYSVRLKTNEL